jgi:hypothetical protein
VETNRGRWRRAADLEMWSTEWGRNLWALRSISQGTMGWN